MITGFDAASYAYGSMMPPEPVEPPEVELDVEALIKAGYFVRWDDARSDWQWGVDDATGPVVFGDGFFTAGEAWDNAAVYWREQQPELCDGCGDQAACPDCVGT